MSTNYTANYKLCQWEPTDQVLRTDFNADNAKIDAALKTQAGQISQALGAAGAAFGPSKPAVVAGVYTGDGAAVRTVNVGFRPQAVVVVHSSLLWSETGGGKTAWYSGVAADGEPSSWTGWTALMVTANGFQVGYVVDEKGSNRSTDVLTNVSGTKYTYFAFR